jgi:transposase
LAAGAASARLQSRRTVRLIDLARSVPISYGLVHGYQAEVGTVSNSKLLGKLLRLEGMKVTGFEFVDDPEETDFRKLTLRVKPFKNGCRCPVCERRCPIISQGWDEREWIDISMLGRRVVLRYRPKEIVCPTHGRAQEVIPWAAPHARLTFRAEWRLCMLSRLMTQKAASQVLCMPKSTVSDNLHRIITRVRTGHRIQGLVSIGIDEVSYKKGQKYVTLVYDLDRAKVLWVGEGKGRATIDRFFTEVLTKEQREAIRWACSDMANGYTEAVKAHCPNATLVIDRFHVVRSARRSGGSSTATRRRWSRACAGSWG